MALRLFSVRTPSGNSENLQRPLDSSIHKRLPSNEARTVSIFGAV
jgi:hypothetical protein